MNPSLSPDQWKARFEQQARWTEQLRHYLYQRASLASTRRVLDLGCGTGALLAELVDTVQGAVFGLDIDPVYLRMAMRNTGTAHCVQADAHWLPYSKNTFDAVLCHFVLLWVTHPERVIAEIARVTRPGGAVLALAEPDYGGRIDYPVGLEQLGQWQAEALIHQGADPSIGRRLAELFSMNDLEGVEVGVLGGQWSIKTDPQGWEAEWEVLEADLKNLVAPETIARLRHRDKKAWQEGKRVLFVPTFYAWGRVRI